MSCEDLVLVLRLNLYFKGYKVPKTLEEIQAHSITELSPYKTLCQGCLFAHSDNHLLLENSIQLNPTYFNFIFVMVGQKRLLPGIYFK